MEVVEEDSQQENSKSSFWHHIFNFKVAVSASLVWLGLICQDFYVYAMHMSWISEWYLPSDAAYIIKWLATLITVYFLFLFINYLIKKTVFKPLYHKKIAYIVLVVWLVMNLSCYQLLYFDYIPELKVYIFKLLHLIALYALVLTITRLIQKFRDKQIKNQLIIAIVLCIIGWVFLLLTYPGTWSYDDIHIINNAAFYYTTPWHHFFSGTFHILCLQTIPFVFSVPLIQILLNALMYSYCVVTLAKIFTKTPRQKLILEILLSVFFIFPPVMFHMLGGFRMGIYQFLELYLLTKLLAIFYDKTHKLTTLKLIEVTFFTIIVGSWRTECFFFPFILLIFLLLLGKERIKRTTAFIMAGISLVSVLYIGMFNTKLLGKENKEKYYSITATMQIVAAVVQEVEDLDSKTLFYLGSVLELDRIKTILNESKYWEIPHAENIKSTFSDIDYTNYLKTVVQLIFKYPKIILKNCNMIFIDTVIPNFCHFPIHYSILNFDKIFDENNYFAYNNQDKITKSYFFQPLNLKLRESIISVFIGIRQDSNNLEVFNITTTYRRFFNIFIPIILAFFSIIIMLLNRKKMELIMLGAIFMQILLIFFIAPTSIPFYYLPIYLFAYVFSTAIIFNNLLRVFSFLRNKLHKKIKD